MASKGSQVSSEYRNGSVAKGSPKPFSFQTSFFYPAASGAWELTAFLKDREGADGSGDTVGPYFLMACSYLILLLTCSLIYVFKK